MSKRWHVYASYSWSNVKTDLTADTAGVIRTTRINFSPRVVVFSAGFSF